MTPLKNSTNGEEKGTKSNLSTPENLNLQSKDSSFFSFFNAPIINKFPSTDLEIKGLYEFIISSKYVPQTEQLRLIKEPEKARKLKSAEFDYVTFSGTFSERQNARLITRSCYICCDLDHIGGEEDILAMQIRIIDKIKPVLMFISPSGDGLKVVFKIHLEAGSHLQFFSALRLYFNDVIGYEIDSSGSDICRACFIPHDPEAYYDENCDILDSPFLDTFAHQPTLPKNVQGSVKKSGKSLDTDGIIDRLEGWLNKSVSFGQGNRNRYVSRLAYACNRYGIPENEALNRLLNYAEPGFLEGEIKAIIKSVYKHTEWFNISVFVDFEPESNQIAEKRYSLVSTRTMPKTPLLPIEGFPNHLQDLINECENVYCTHRDFWAIAFLQATAIAIGSSFEIKDKYSNGAVLWVATVAPSGMGKSEPMDMALKPIIEADSIALEAYNYEKAKYLEMMELSTKERKEQGVQKMDCPTLKQYIAVDITPEALIEAHANNRRGIAICRDELTGWICDFGRYSRSGEVQNMLSSWSEKHFKINRKNSLSAAIKKPFIPVFGGIQPGKLYQMAKDDRALDGFMQRFIFAYPDECVKPDYNEAILREQFMAYYKEYIQALLSINCDRRPILLSPNAKLLYKEFYNLNTALFNAETDEYMKAVYQKFEIIVLRLALILHVSKYALSGQIEQPIQPEVMSASIQMVEYFRITAQKVNIQIGQAISPSGKLDKRSVARYLIGLERGTKVAIANVLGTSRSQLDRLLE